MLSIFPCNIASNCCLPSSFPFVFFFYLYCFASVFFSKVDVFFCKIIFFFETKSTRVEFTMNNDAREVENIKQKKKLCSCNVCQGIPRGEATYLRTPVPARPQCISTYIKSCLKFHSAEDKRQQSYVYEEQAASDIATTAAETRYYETEFRRFFFVCLHHGLRW